MHQVRPIIRTGFSTIKTITNYSISFYGLSIAFGRFGRDHRPSDVDLKLRIPAFIALLIASISAGLFAGMDAATIIDTIKKGMGVHLALWLP